MSGFFGKLFGSIFDDPIRPPLDEDQQRQFSIVPRYNIERNDDDHSWWGSGGSSSSDPGSLFDIFKDDDDKGGGLFPW